MIETLDPEGGANEDVSKPVFCVMTSRGRLRIVVY